VIFQFTKLLGSVDVSCLVGPGGCSSQAGAIRYATSLCLRSFVDDQTLEEMRLAGLLTQNVRVPERKKPGQMKARRKFTWKRR
jgi:small subunit ribosomal protein S9